jgi:hypothetical protein
LNQVFVFLSVFDHQVAVVEEFGGGNNRFMGGDFFLVHADGVVLDRPAGFSLGGGDRGQFREQVEDLDAICDGLCRNGIRRDLLGNGSQLFFAQVYEFVSAGIASKEEFGNVEDGAVSVFSMNLDSELFGQEAFSVPGGCRRVPVPWLRLLLWISG